MQKKALNWICYKGLKIKPSEAEISNDAAKGRKPQKTPSSCECSLEFAKEKGIECFSKTRVNAVLESAGSLPLSDESALSMLNLPDPFQEVEAFDLSLTEIEEILNNLPLNHQQLDAMPQTIMASTRSFKRIHTQANPIWPKSGKKRKADGPAATAESKNTRSRTDKRRKESITNLADVTRARPEVPFLVNGAPPTNEAYTGQNGLSDQSNLAAAFDHEALDDDLQNMRDLDELAAEALEWLESESIDVLPVPTADLPLSSAAESQLPMFPNDGDFSESLDAEGLTIAAALDAEQEPPSLSQIFGRGRGVTMGVADPYKGPLARLTDTGEATRAGAGAGERAAGVYPNGLPFFL